MTIHVQVYTDLINLGIKVGQSHLAHNVQLVDL